MNDQDDELPYIQRATASGILQFFAEAEKLMPKRYLATSENSELLDRLFSSRRTPPVPQEIERPTP